jgi:deoxyribonuclease IV
VQFGAHVSSAGGINTAIDRIEAMGGDCVQVFTQSPRMWRPTNHKPEAIKAFHERRAEAGIGGVVCHALYLCNIATPDDTVFEKSVSTLGTTVDAAVAIGADAVIFHVGSHLGSGIEAGLARAAAALPRVLEHCEGDTWLLMENSAGTGATVGRSVDELVDLFDRLDAHPRLGICLDSCHLFASGYDIGDPKEVDKLVKDLDKRIGLDRVRALHVNDSQTPLGSNRDRHANMLEGEIGERLGAFLAHPAFQGLSAYLETSAVDDPKTAPGEITKLRELHARWT